MSNSQSAPNPVELMYENVNLNDSPGGDNDSNVDPSDPLGLRHENPFYMPGDSDGEHGDHMRYSLHGTLKSNRGHAQKLMGQILKRELNHQPCPVVPDLVRWKSHVSGVEIQFPHLQPYPAQVILMSRIIKACNGKKHAYIESPTGTGKTAALACSALAWQRHHTLNKWAEFNGVSKTIVYATRTHSQVKQVSQELKRLPYRPVITVLGSRDRLCTNDKAKDEAKKESTSLNNICSNLVNKACCNCYSNISDPKYVDKVVDLIASQFNDISLKANPSSGVWDIEEMGEFGKRNTGCGYYTSSAILPSAHIVICPYQYILDYKTCTQRFRDLDLENCVVLLDEAHNVEDVCRGAGSSDCGLYDLLQAADCLCVAHSVNDMSWANVAKDLPSNDKLIDMREALGHAMKVIDKLVMWLLNEVELFKANPKAKFEAQKDIRKTPGSRHSIRKLSGTLGLVARPNPTRMDLRKLRQESDECKGEIKVLRQKIIAEKSRLDEIKQAEAEKLKAKNDNVQGDKGCASTCSVTNEAGESSKAEITDVDNSTDPTDKPSSGSVEQVLQICNEAHADSQTSESDPKIEGAEQPIDVSNTSSPDDEPFDIEKARESIRELTEKVSQIEDKIALMEEEYEARSATNQLFQEANISDDEIQLAVSSVETIRTYLEDPKARQLFRKAGEDSNSKSFNALLETGVSVITTLSMMRECPYDYSVALQASYNKDLNVRPVHLANAFEASMTTGDTTDRNCCRNRIHTVGGFMHGDYLRASHATEPEENEWVFHLGMWLMSPEVVFEKVSARVHSLILTSGTLQPSHPAELGTVFEERLQAHNNLPHVIDKHQLFVAPIPKCPSGKALNGTTSSVKNLQPGEYEKRIGNTVLQVLKSGIARRGGTIVFVPSFAKMRKFLQVWEESGILDELERCVGPVLSEQVAGGSNSSFSQRGASQSSYRGRNNQRGRYGGNQRGRYGGNQRGRYGGNQRGRYGGNQRGRYGGNQRGRDRSACSDDEDFTMSDNETKVDDELDEDTAAVVKRYQKLCDTNRSPILIAVCRAKLSEGIDFSNDYCRAVFCVSIPFPQYGEQVRLKMSFNDAKHKENENICPGKQWYTQQAYRALNQAMGRCIRHAKDYGSIFLLDERFVTYERSTFHKYIPSWIASKAIFTKDLNEMTHLMNKYSDHLTQRIAEEKRKEELAKSTVTLQTSASSTTGTVQLTLVANQSNSSQSSQQESNAFKQFAYKTPDQTSSVPSVVVAGKSAAASGSSSVVIQKTKVSSKKVSVSSGKVVSNNYNKSKATESVNTSSQGLSGLTPEAIEDILGDSDSGDEGDPIVGVF